MPADLTSGRSATVPRPALLAVERDAMMQVLAGNWSILRRRSGLMRKIVRCDTSIISCIARTCLKKVHLVQARRGVRRTLERVTSAKTLRATADAPVAPREELADHVLVYTVD